MRPKPSNSNVLCPAETKRSPALSLFWQKRYFSHFPIFPICPSVVFSLLPELPLIGRTWAEASWNKSLHMQVVGLTSLQYRADKRQKTGLGTKPVIHLTNISWPPWSKRCAKFDIVEPCEPQSLTSRGRDGHTNTVEMSYNASYILWSVKYRCSLPQKYRKEAVWAQGMESFPKVGSHELHFEG